jgi:transcriptional regulator with XRE-family HTH domain
MGKIDDVLERIRQFRKAKGVTQLEMSEKIGMAKNNYGKLENGHIELSVKRLLDISEILGVSVFSILGHESGKEEKIGQLELELVTTRAEKIKAEESLATINRLFAILTASVESKETEIVNSLAQAPDFLNLLKSAAEDVKKDTELVKKAQKAFKKPS